MRIIVLFLVALAVRPVPQTPVYVLVANASRSEYRLQTTLLQGVPRAHIVTLDAPTSLALNAALSTLIRERRGIVAIPYAQCMKRIPDHELLRTERLIRRLRRLGFLILAASGNHGATCDGIHTGFTYPAMVKGVCSVGALTSSRSIWTESGRYTGAPNREYSSRMPLTYAGGIYTGRAMTVIGTSVAVTRAALRRSISKQIYCQEHTMNWIAIVPAIIVAMFYLVVFTKVPMVSRSLGFVAVACAEAVFIERLWNVSWVGDMGLLIAASAGFIVAVFLAYAHRNNRNTMA